jgi:hypothetical protein
LSCQAEWGWLFPRVVGDEQMAGLAACNTLITVSLPICDKDSLGKLWCVQLRHRRRMRMGNYRYKTVLSNLLAPVAWFYLQSEAASASLNGEGRGC